MEDASVLFAKLEERGAEQVRIELAQSIWSEPRKVALIKEWLSLKDRARAAEDSAKRDTREEETLSIARRALSIAEGANIIATRDLSAALSQARWAKWAAIIATIAAVIATKDQILALIFGNL